MDASTAIALGRQVLVEALTLMAPLLGVSLVVGVVVALFQALTSIQEQTLTFVPKIASMIIAAILLMPWIAQRLLEYAAEIFSGG